MSIRHAFYAVLLLVGFALGGLFAVARDGNAQDTDQSGRIAALETQVNTLERHDATLLSNYEDLSNELRAQLLPPPDAHPSFAGGILRFSPGTGFVVYCTISDPVSTLSLERRLVCARVDPAADPLAPH